MRLVPVKKEKNVEYRIWTLLYLYIFVEHICTNGISNMLLTHQHALWHISHRVDDEYARHTGSRYESWEEDPCAPSVEQLLKASSTHVHTTPGRNRSGAIMVITLFSRIRIPNFRGDVIGTSASIKSLDARPTSWIDSVQWQLHKYPWIIDFCPHW